MRKILIALTAAAATMMASQAMAQSHRHHVRAAAPVAGAVAGTVVGIGLHNHWYGSHGAFWGSTFPTSWAGAATTGLVAGVATAALIHAATTPCQGFHALLGNLITTSEGCVNGQYVGHQPRRASRRR